MGTIAIDYDCDCDKNDGRYKQKQPISSKKLRSNMAMFQENGKNEYSPCNL